MACCFETCVVVVRKLGQGIDAEVCLEQVGAYESFGQQEGARTLVTERLEVAVLAGNRNGGAAVSGLFFEALEERVRALVEDRKALATRVVALSDLDRDVVAIAYETACDVDVRWLDRADVEIGGNDLRVDRRCEPELRDDLVGERGDVGGSRPVEPIESEERELLHVL